MSGFETKSTKKWSADHVFTSAEELKVFTAI